MTARTEGITQDGGRTEPLIISAIEGPGAGPSLLLERGSIRVGSADPCELKLEDPSVSRAHASLELMAGAVRVRDLGSRNGTFYAGARIQEAVVPAGGVVRLGRTTLRLARESRTAPAPERTALHGLIGGAPPMLELYAVLERLAASPAPVLIRGETGAGKEAVARALHALSSRADKPFAVLDCGAVSPSLLESELFGHVRGAFTGAEVDRAGAFETAGWGTLFLDEVGEVPLELQPKFLRVLATRELKRLGESKPRHVACRVVAATNRNLEAEVQAGRFRADFFHRLAVTMVDVPPLRARREDIPLLAQHFVKEIAGEGARLPAATLVELQSREWKGNVRELRNVVERALTVGDGLKLPVAAPGEAKLKEGREQLVQAYEKDYLVELLQKHGGNVSRAAKEAGVSRSQMYRLLERHGVAPQRG